LPTVVVAVNYPIMSTYISPYYCIATSGTTRDGRVIKPEWLTSAAETYDPEEAEALLWYDHSRWYNPGGAVVDCKTQVLDDKRVQLLARIKPTAALMYEAEQLEVPYLFSVELRPMEDGRYYLDGLAYTHDPASKAVDKMEFSKQRPDIQLGDAETVEKLEFAAKGLLSRLFGKTPPVPPKRIDPPDIFIKETEDMTPEQDTLLKAAHDFGKQVGADIKTLLEKYSAMETQTAEKFTALEKLQTDKFTALENAQKETHAIVEEIGKTSQGRFKFKRPPAGGGNTDTAADIDY
jgi:hypothetical protein